MNFRTALRNRSERGFTLLEVLAALMVAGVALTCILEIEVQAQRNAGRARALRRAAALAESKLQEVLSGLEPASSGDFPGMEGWTWSVSREPFPGRPGFFRVVLEVRFPGGKGGRTVKLEEVAP